MPKNQFQRPAPVKHTRDVPRHGAPRMTQPKGAAKRVGKAQAAVLPPLSTLLERPAGK